MGCDSEFERQADRMQQEQKETEAKPEVLSHGDALVQLRAIEDLPIGSNGHGTSSCYRVQARVAKGCAPKKVAGAFVGMMSDHALTDSKWETLTFPKGPLGVPASPSYEHYARHGYLSYAAAQALRWWFLAEQPGLTFIETRLVEYVFKHNYSAEAVAVHGVIDPAKREDIMPDWGKPKEKVENN